MEVAYIALGVTVPQINHVYMFNMTGHRNNGKLRFVFKIQFHLKKVY